jgi:AcrR family transcriptional regulator
MSPKGRTEGRTGRRAGHQPTRDTILTAARARFASQGYAGTTIRAVAADAGVDPALVAHYFSSKAKLFATSVNLPVAPDALIATIVDRPLDAVGEAILRTILSITDEPGSREAWLGMIRSAAADGHGAAVLREFLAEEVLGPIGARLESEGVADAPLRMTLVGSQIVGLAFGRHVIGIEPLASATDDELVAALAPTLQRYLTGDISGGG